VNLNSVVNTVLISSALALLPTQVLALSADPQISPDYSEGYERKLFGKDWIDADKNGCNTRAEVLIAEAVVKPKVGKNCSLTGGKWVSAYDAKIITDASKLDVDHLVPLKEAWRSGAWAWTPKQRQDYANDLTDSRALIAVTLNSNRSKLDKDISDWLPAIDKCGYIKNWVAIKMRYSLTFDEGESLVMRNYFQTCSIGDIKVAVLPGYKYQSSSVTTSPDVKPETTPTPTSTSTSTSKISYSISSPNLIASTFKPGGNLNFRFSLTTNNPKAEPVYCYIDAFVNPFEATRVAGTSSSGTYSCDSSIPNNPFELFPGGRYPLDVLVIYFDEFGKQELRQTFGYISFATPTPAPSPTASQSPISPGAFCAPAGATGVNSSGVKYTCKTSDTDTRNRWRQ